MPNPSNRVAGPAVSFTHPRTGWTVDSEADWHITILLRHGWESTVPGSLLPYVARRATAHIGRLGMTAEVATRRLRRLHGASVDYALATSDGASEEAFREAVR